MSEKICPYIKAPCIGKKCEAYKSEYYKNRYIYTRTYPVLLKYDSIEETKDVEETHCFGLIKKIVKQKVKRKLTDEERIVKHKKIYEIVAQIKVYRFYCEKISNVTCEYEEIIDSYYGKEERDDYYFFHALDDFKGCNKETKDKILKMYDKDAQKYVGLVE